MSEPVLDAEEVAALMQAVAPEEAADALFATLPPLRQPEKVDDFQFSDDEQIGPDQYPMFGTLHERIGEMATERWSNVFRREIPVFFKELLEQSYLEILDADEPRVYFTLEAPSLGAMLVVCDMSLAVSYIDAMLGGSGVINADEGDALTAVEYRLAERIAEAIGNMLGRVWQPIRQIEFKLRRMDTDPMSLALTADDVGCFSVSHIIVLNDDLRGELSVHYPLSFLEPMLEAMRTSHERGKTQFVDEQWERDLHLALNQSPLQLRVELGRCRMRVEDFIHLEPGDMLPLIMAEDEPATLCIEEHPAFDAQAGQHQGMLAVELLEPIKTGGDT